MNQGKNDNWKSCLKKYLASTSLHGLKYLAIPRSPLYQRIYWMVAILAVYCTVTFVIIDQIQKFIQNPVLISLDSRTSPVSKIPFPAITICPDNQIRPSIFNLTQALADINAVPLNRSALLDYAITTCRIAITFKGMRDNYNYDFLNKMLSSVNGVDQCREIIPKMIWLSKEVNNTCRYLQPTSTFAGACLTFNMLPLEQLFRFPDGMLSDGWKSKRWQSNDTIWTPDYGYSTNYTTDIPPWRTAGNNPENTIVFLLHSDNDIDDACRADGKGFTVFVHNPAEFPGTAHSVIHIENEKIEFVHVSPKMYITEETLRDWYPEQRGCYYQEERYLMFFKIYTQKNCDLECEANITLERCGCVTPYHPRQANTPVCAAKKTPCAINSLIRNGQDSDMFCNCLPSCSEIEYDISTIEIKRSWGMLKRSHPSQFRDFKSILEVLFLNRYIIPIRRKMLFGASDFIANIGGLLGLFLGFSILSLVELIYFLTFLPCRDIFRRNPL